ncbi:hypothetical protein [Haloarchaeobius baliensis]|uniref:hypothetical protein n=1 Tax=Haloarchaeobius baliensis TaxID=1670458 RepID=UPI003F882181
MTEVHPHTDTGSPADYDALVAFLQERYAEELRWVATFQTTTYRYDVRYIRSDLKTELSTHDLDTVIHRSIALFNRPYLEKVYTHLGHVRSFVLQHERATAVHLYLGGGEGIVIKVRRGASVTLPDFVDECLDVLYDRPRR